MSCRCSVLRTCAAMLGNRKSRLLTIVALVGLAAAFGVPNADAALPAPEFCQKDIQSANDQPGQKDLTQFCVEIPIVPEGGPGPELNTRWAWDDRQQPGGNTADACTLYDTGTDGLANLAVCVTTRDGEQPMTMAALRLYTCGNTRPDRCTSALLISDNKCVGGPKAGLACAKEDDCKTNAGEGNCMPDPSINNTTCEVAQLNIDPFPAGANYPVDSAATCLSGPR